MCEGERKKGPTTEKLRSASQEKNIEKVIERITQCASLELEYECVFIHATLCDCVCTYSCAANIRLIFATCSLSSMSLSPWSPLNFLLVGLMGGGPVLWLEMEEEEEEDDDDEEEDEDEEDRDRDWSLGSPLKAASPEDKREKKEKQRTMST